MAVGCWLSCASDGERQIYQLHAHFYQQPYCTHQPIAQQNNNRVFLQVDPAQPPAPPENAWACAGMARHHTGELALHSRRGLWPAQSMAACRPTRARPPPPYHPPRHMYAIRSSVPHSLQSVGALRRPSQESRPRQAWSPSCCKGRTARTSPAHGATAGTACSYCTRGRNSSPPRHRSPPARCRPACG